MFTVRQQCICCQCAEWWCYQYAVLSVLSVVGCPGGKDGPDIEEAAKLAGLESAEEVTEHAHQPMDTVSRYDCSQHVCHGGVIN